MNIQAEKLDIIERFKQINDTALISAIKGMLDYAQKDKRISLENYNKELTLSETQIQKGKGVSHSDFIDQVEQW